MSDVRAGLLDRLHHLPGSNGWPEAGYVIDSMETDDHVTHDYAFCYEHAQIVAHGESILTGCEMYAANVSQSETDSEEWCAFYGCDKPLNTGSPTSYWVDSALGLTETDPYECHVSKYELLRSYWNMTPTDERWPVWERQARRLLKNTARRAM